MGKYAKGYRRDLPHKRTQKDAGPLLRALPAAPASANHEANEYRPILDQSNAGSCTGHGTAQALYTAFSIDGEPLAWCPSPKGVYANVRAKERADTTPSGATLPVLTDSGAMPSDIMVVISTYGIMPMQAPSPQGYISDVDASNVNEDPKLGDLEKEALCIVTGEYRIDETASDFIAQVCTALASGGAKGLGAPIGLGIFVDTAFENWDPSQPPLSTVNLNDPQGGGHWVCATSYRTDANGKIVFRGPNSWGVGWGDQGHFEFTEDWLKASCMDCYPFLAQTVLQKKAA